MIKLLSAVLFLVLVFPAQADEEIPFDISATEACLTGKKGSEQQQCIGTSAGICMETEAGGTTVGMGYCLNQELEWWDAKLNVTYRDYLAAEKANDVENQESEIQAPLKAPALVTLQRTWIKYRDALCEQQAVQWGGGTGAGPAFLGCLMEETARQTLLLEDGLNWANR